MADREVQENKEYLKKLLKTAKYRVFTIVRSVSRSGMNRVIDPIVFIDSWSPVYIGASVASVLGWKQADRQSGIKVSGCGMDMCFHLVYELSSVLFKDGYKLKQVNL